MRTRRRFLIVILTLITSLIGSGTAFADEPLGPARSAPCPPPTGTGSLYTGSTAPYRCHSAVVDPLGNVVILRQGRSDAGPGAFGMLHALVDHNVEDIVIERVVSSSYPRTAPGRRFRYSAELRVRGEGIIDVWVEVDRSASRQAPDSQPFGVVTAYCKIPANASPENKCPSWVNDSMR